jgi:hypothetical protein
VFHIPDSGRLAVGDQGSGKRMSGNTLKRRICGARSTAVTAIAAGCVLAAGLALTGCGSAASSAANSTASTTTGGSTASAAASTSSGVPSASTSAAAGGGSGSSASVPYPVGVGNTWKYKVIVGTETGTTTDKMTAVVPVSDGQQVTTTSTSDLLGSTSTSTATYVFRSDGSIVYPLNGLDESSGSNGVSVTGSGVVWPPASVIDSGKPTTSALKLSIKEEGKSLSTTAHITVQGAGTQTVTVPAGTYQATVVNMTEAFSFEGVSLTIEIRTWLAAGIGPVKDEVIENVAGTSHVTATTELESFTKG